MAVVWSAYLAVFSRSQLTDNRFHPHYRVSPPGLLGSGLGAKVHVGVAFVRIRYPRHWPDGHASFDWCLVPIWKHLSH